MGGNSTTLLGSPFQCLITFSLKKFFLISNLNLALAQLETISLGSIACHLRKETNALLTATSFPVAVETIEVSPQLPLLQPQFPQLLLISLVFLSLHQLLCSSLPTLEQLIDLPLVRGPRQHTVFRLNTIFHQVSFTEQ